MAAGSLPSKSLWPNAFPHAVCKGTACGLRLYGVRPWRGLPKVVFCVAKDGLLRCKRPSFRVRKVAFRIVKDGLLEGKRPPIAQRAATLLRYCDGERPVCFCTYRLKYDSDENPKRSEISVSDSSLRQSIRTIALTVKRSIQYVAGLPLTLRHTSDR